MNTHTHRRMALSVALGGLCAAAVLNAPPVHADARGFLIEMTDMGFTHTDGYAGLLRLGYGVCEMLSVPGTDGNDVARAIYVSTGWEIDRTDSQIIVIASVEQLCPEYDGRAQAVA